MIFSIMWDKPALKTRCAEINILHPENRVFFFLKDQNYYLLSSFMHYTV